MLDLQAPERQEAAAAWLRLAQGVSMADRRVASCECETTVQFSLTLLGISSEELREAKRGSDDLTIAMAAGILRPLADPLKRMVLLGLVNVAFADHEFKRPENELLSSIANFLELPATDLVDAFIAARRMVDATGRPIDADPQLFDEDDE
ncbi:MAG: hypothetical protein CMJ23_04720 [Phycisphaerae bacterium]|nr:hypothetical protein [Phycisphaerae bacterium]